MNFSRIVIIFGVCGVTDYDEKSTPAKCIKNDTKTHPFKTAPKNGTWATPWRPRIDQQLVAKAQKSAWIVKRTRTFRFGKDLAGFFVFF
jgi:hypothetical protein